jgi:alpha-beta hydrolase superfamily lysophospholipase
MQSKTSTHSASDGTALHVYEWSPDEGTPVRAVMHIAHGMAEHAKRYERLAEELTKHGFVVYANDHRAHGKTAKPGELGHLDVGFDVLVRDLERLVTAEIDAHPGKPFVLFGHSMGSFMVQAALPDLSTRLAGAVLSASNGKPTPIAAAGRLVARAERLRVGPRGASPVIKALSFGAFNKMFAPNRTANDWLSRDAAEVDKYEADPLCGFDCSTSTWIALLDALGPLTSPEHQAKIRKDLPLYVFAGALDPVSEKTKGLRQLLDSYAKVGLTDVKHRFYEGGRHEMLNETNRDEVTRDLVAWLDEKVLR